jgi:hypothetical protein
MIRLNTSRTKDAKIERKKAAVPLVNTIQGLGTYEVCSAYKTEPKSCSI